MTQHKTPMRHLSRLVSRRLQGFAVVCCLALSGFNTIQADDILDLLPAIINAIGHGGALSVTDLQGNRCTLTPAEKSLLDLHNAARQSGRVCGATVFPAAPDLRWSCRIGQTATRHSNEMSANRNLSHTGSNGSNAGQRLTANGYSWNRWGENIASGRFSPEGTMSQWLNSPPHCANLMDPGFREIGASPDESAGNYWTAVFGSRQ